MFRLRPFVRGAIALAAIIGLSPLLPASAAGSAIAPVSQPNTTDLAAYRASLLQKQSSAIEIHNATIDAKRQQLVKDLGYEPETTDPREIARQMMLNKYQWDEQQFNCYDSIIMRESKWIWNADNPTSSAYGIPQALPGSKMASAGADWRTNPATQIKWGLGYVAERYGTPCQAWSYKRSHGWY